MVCSYNPSLEAEWRFIISRTLGIMGKNDYCVRNLERVIGLALPTPWSDFQRWQCHTSPAESFDSLNIKAQLDLAHTYGEQEQERLLVPSASL